MKNNKMKLDKSKSIFSLVIILIIAVVALLGFLAARYFIDDGHDIVASHDTFDVKIVAQNSETGDLYDVKDGIITIENASGFKSNESLPIIVDIYYKGESYAYIRFMLLEQWLGTYSENMGGIADRNGILPEPMMPLSLNEDIPMADNRAKDSYIYLTQIQTNLTDSEVDTNWKNQDEILNTKSSDEQMYTYENGKFVQSENGEYRKLSIIKQGGVSTPQFTDEADSVNSATATTLNLYLEADAVQFNRFETFWNITTIPEQTNIPDEITD
ncbi:MAG: hypothetical protein K2H13_08465 [Eubacterium sp.]|nr:hypothetical protein [Eubacterium sp.]